MPIANRTFSGLRRSVAVLSLLALGACVGAPVQEMSDARQAIHAAELADAASFAGESLTAARDLLSRAESKLQGRDYRGARQDALDARQNAVNALELSAQQTPPKRR